MAGPFGVGPSVPGNSSFRAAPPGIMSRPIPVPLTTGPVVGRPPVLVPGTVPGGVLGGARPLPTMPGVGIAPPSRAGGLPQRPPVLVPGGNPAFGRPMPTAPGVTLPGRTSPGVMPPRTGGYAPQQPPVLVPGGTPGGVNPTVPGGRPMPTVPPGIGQYPSRAGTPTNGQCGMFNNYGLIGFFDKTVGAVVKRLMGMRDTCIPGYSGTGSPTMTAPGSMMAPGTMTAPGVTPGAGLTPGGRVMPQMTPRVYR